MNIPTQAKTGLEWATRRRNSSDGHKERQIRYDTRYNGPRWPEAYNPVFDQKGMDYVKGILSGLAAIFLAEFVPGSWSIFRGMSQEKATGLAAVAGGLTASVLSPLFWTLAVLFFALFFAASRLGHKILRVFLFWIPTLMVSAFGLALVALFTYVFIDSRHRLSGQ